MKSEGRPSFMAILQATSCQAILDLRSIWRCTLGGASIGYMFLNDTDYGRLQVTG